MLNTTPKSCSPPLRVIPYRVVPLGSNVSRPCGSLPVDDAHAKENSVWKFAGVCVGVAVGVGVGADGSKEKTTPSPLSPPDAVIHRECCSRLLFSNETPTT